MFQHKIHAICRKQGYGPKLSFKRSITYLGKVCSV